MGKELTAAVLRSTLSYNRETGEFRWLRKASHRVEVGEIAGSVVDGYIKIQIDGRKYLAHRLAWLHVTGDWPEAEIDHRDGCGTNNRWRNLRPATRSSNMQNQRRARRDNRTGLLGAHRQGDGFQSSINVGGRALYLGYFPTAEQAHAAYMVAKRQHHAVA